MGSMTIMLIDYNLLTQGSLQFIGICANELTFKSINKIQHTFFAALSAETKTYFIWNFWIPRLSDENNI